MGSSVKTKGGRTLRQSYSVQFVNGHWVVGIGPTWGGPKMTLFEARAECRKRNKKL